MLAIDSSCISVLSQRFRSELKPEAIFGLKGYRGLPGCRCGSGRVSFVDLKVLEVARHEDEPTVKISNKCRQHTIRIQKKTKTGDKAENMTRRNRFYGGVFYCTVLKLEGVPLDDLEPVSDSA